MIATMFDTTVARLGLNRRHRAVYEPVAEASGANSDDEPTTFQRPPPKKGQLNLF
jgi:hypothetical protein